MVVVVVCLKSLSSVGNVMVLLWSTLATFTLINGGMITCFTEHHC